MNIHPMVVHFPIALLIVGFAFATLSILCKKCNTVGTTDPTKPSCIQKVAYWLLALGALGAVAAAASGALFTNSPTAGPLVAMYTKHVSLAISTITVSLITAAIYTYYMYKARTKQVLMIGYALYVVCVILVSLAGHFGGEMVYFLK